MQTQNLINSLQALYRSATPLIVAENIPVSKLEIGQRIQATIKEQLSPGLFKVEVAGQTLQMQLPGQLKSGNLIQLQVMSNNPRLTFGFVASSNPLPTQEQISSTSRFLSNLTELPRERTMIQSAAGQPVWPASGPAIDSRQLAVALHNALGNSGLFYESHQAQWVRGERSTAQLLVEPQNLLKNNDSTATATQPDKAAAAAQADTTPPGSGLPITKELVSMVQQQLHTLETHQLTWTGQIWPGQQMQWEIQGEPERQQAQPGQHQDPYDGRKWSTEMELALPALGDVHAKLVLSQGKLTLTLQAADVNSAALLNRRLPGLATTLGEAGIPLASAVVEKA
ncbi:MAG: flagellar hook-length control protein FliK [Gallionella sp.]|jgi:hypothetical protein